jgi:Glyoxalase-like domain
MAIARFKDLCVDAGDPARLGPFWASLLGLAWEAQDDGDGVLTGPTPQHTIWVNRVPEPKTVKHRVHLDVHARDLADLRQPVERPRAQVRPRDLPAVADLAAPAGPGGVKLSRAGASVTGASVMPGSSRARRGAGRSCTCTRSRPQIRQKSRGGSTRASSARLFGPVRSKSLARGDRSPTLIPRGGGSQ